LTKGSKRESRRKAPKAPPRKTRAKTDTKVKTRSKTKTGAKTDRSRQPSKEKETASEKTVEKGTASGSTGKPDRPVFSHHEEALREFFASAEELEAVGAMSLDLYRDQLDFRLRAAGVQEYLSFVLADETYAVNIRHIKEIIKPPLITEVPRTEPVILGILSLRGTIAPVVDLRRRLGLETAPQTRKTRILIVDILDGLAGLLVDEVQHVIRLKDKEIEPPPGVFDRAEAEHIVGVGRQEGEMYTLLELESVVQIDRFIKATTRSRTE
jgi:purine-binding chemotaxis protein CheW